MDDKATRPQRCSRCGSYALNLWSEGIDQGDLCDVHYWQARAEKAEAAALSQKAEPKTIIFDNPSYPAWLAARPSAQKAEAPGWVTVPVEPDLAMVIAGENFIGRHAWAKMIAAAPKATL